MSKAKRIAAILVGAALLRVAFASLVLADSASPAALDGTVIPIDVDTLDFAEPDGLADAVDRLAPALIINPAAYTAVDKAEDEPDLAMAVNATAPGIIARWAAARAVGKCQSASSAAVHPLTLSD